MRSSREFFFVLERPNLVIEESLVVNTGCTNLFLRHHRVVMSSYYWLEQRCGALRLICNLRKVQTRPLVVFMRCAHTLSALCPCPLFLLMAYACFLFIGFQHLRTLPCPPFSVHVLCYSFPNRGLFFCLCAVHAFSSWAPHALARSHVPTFCFLRNP